LPTKLTTKFPALGLNSSLCNWVLDFLTGHPHVVKVANMTSSTLTHNQWRLRRGELLIIMAIKELIEWHQTPGNHVFFIPFH
jgi:hypothetical protein